MAISLPDIDRVAINICADNKERLLATTYAETFALTDSVEVRAVVGANLLAVTNSIAVWSRHTL